ncbi:DEAD/DEAH box helicase [uncultured Robinsoniella sp.]|uniref:DEAD/DEAH box helicase n=1 Tax=uncultured Robinsoniella sp. TaxID=904190 RepID=UPI00374EF2AB
MEHIHALKIPTRTETVQVEGKPTDFGPWNDAYEIREYQKPLVEALVAENGIGVAPAGSGKTIMGMRFIYEVGRPTLWLTHTKDLMYQTKERAESTLKGVGRVGILGDGVQDYGDGKLIIATVQTLKANPKLVQGLKDYIGVVVIDEAHHFPSTQFLDTAAQFPANRIVGLTATPKRKDELEEYMYQGIGPVLYEVPRTALYETDQLVLPEVRFIYTGFNYGDDGSAEGNVDAGGEDLDYQNLLYHIIADQDRLQLIGQTIVEALSYGQAIVLAESVRYCFKLQEVVKRLSPKTKTAVVHGGLQRYSWKVAGSKSQAETLAKEYGTEYKYDGKARRYKVKTPQYTEAEFKKWQVTPKRRKEILEACRSGDIQILFATQLAREGLDIPQLSVGHTVTPKRGDTGNNKTGLNLEQEIGRIMRPDPRNPDKKAVWFDYVDANVGVLKGQYYSRRKVYKRLGIKLPSKPKDADKDVIEGLLDGIKY